MNAPLRNALVLLRPQLAPLNAVDPEPDLCPLCGLVHMPEPVAALAPVRDDSLGKAALEMLRITAQAFGPLHNDEAAPMPLEIRKQWANLRKAYRKQSGQGYIDAENQEWFKLPEELRMAVLLVAQVSGNLKELAHRDWRETPPPERAAIKAVVRSAKRHFGGVVALASLW